LSDAQPPFRFGEIVDGDYFADRAPEADELATEIRRGLNVVLISPRRFGKTSLVMRVLDRLRGEGVQVAYVDMLRTPTKPRLAEHLATAIYEGFVSGLDRARERAASLFEHLPLRPRVTLHPDGSISFEFTAGVGADPRDMDATIERLLEMFKRRDGPRAALVLDEFQEVVDLDRHLLALMRSVFQRQPEVAHVFLGSRQHLLRKVFADSGEPLYRMARPMSLGPIPADFLVPFVRERFAAGRSQISAEAAGFLVELTGGNPNATQELGHFTWSVAVAESRPANRETVLRAMDRVIAAESARFTDLWETLTPPQRNVLQAVAAGDGTRIFGEDARRKHQLGSATGVQRALQRLVDREIVQVLERGSYTVGDVFLEQWLRRM
jgi:AAA+ ATPase superfamily predicted ATPase